MSNIVNIRNKIQQHFNDKREEYLTRRKSNARRKWGKYYHTPQWQSLREWKFLNNPICEVCSKQNIISPTIEVHHLHTFGSAASEEGKWNLLLSPDNLCSCCSHHHDLFHKYMREHNTNHCTIDELIDYEDKLNSLMV